MSIAVIGGLSHVPYVYFYASTALKTLGSDIEEAARTAGAPPLRVAFDVNLPMIRPALIFSAVLVFFAGVELFGLALVLGNQNGFNMLAVYLYKLTSRLGLPAYHLMAGVAVCMILLSFPLVFMQRYFLRSADRYAALRGKHGRQTAIRLGKWNTLILAFVVSWLFLPVFLSPSGLLIWA